jgi:hypothetical protein
MKSVSRFVASGLLLLFLPGLQAKEEMVATAVYGRVGNGYKRTKLKDGTFKPEYYALSNGGRIYGTASDITVERVGYPEVAEIAMKLLAGQNYHYARSAEQAKLLIVLQWGNTIAFDRESYSLNVNHASSIMAELSAIFGPQGMGGMERGGVGSLSGTTSGGVGMDGGPTQQNTDPSVGERFEAAMLQLMMDNRVRDQINERNARVLGYLDDLADSNDIRRWAGGGDRYMDLIGDVEESRYYIVISAYDFPELANKNNKKLLWQTRVSVRSPGNRFYDSVGAMMKSASKYFGQDSGRLIRGEETKGTVELGDLKFLGEAKDAKQEAPK